MLTAEEQRLIRIEQDIKIIKTELFLTWTVLIIVFFTISISVMN